MDSERLPIALTWDDVALVPQFNNVKSRSEPSLETWLTKSIKTGLPFIPANMDTVISPALAVIIHEYGGTSIMHRFVAAGVSDEHNKYPKTTWISWGVRGETADDLIEVIYMIGIENLGGVCIDVAHAHSEDAMWMIESVKQNFGDDVQVIAGNVCTARGYRDLVNAGADAVKVGVGCGAACTTRVVTGFGVPQFSAIQECAAEASRLRVPIIADGGIRNSRDIILALAAGASTVMMGKLFAACEESAAEKRTSKEVTLTDPKWAGPGWTVETQRKEAKYRGQASFDFQQEFYGEVKHAPEGEAMWIPVTGSANDVIDKLSAQIRAGLTYGGARDIRELQRKAEFVRVTSTYQAESGIRP